MNTKLKHLQGQHNQKLHGNRGVKVTAHSLINLAVKSSQYAFLARDSMDEIRSNYPDIVAGSYASDVMEHLSTFFQNTNKANGLLREAVKLRAENPNHPQMKSTISGVADAVSNAKNAIEEAEIAFNRFMESKYLIDTGKIRATEYTKKQISGAYEALKSGMRRVGVNPKKESGSYTRFGFTQDFGHYFSDKMFKKFSPQLSSLARETEWAQILSMLSKQSFISMPYNPNLFKEHISSVVIKHMPGGKPHDQKTHGHRGWRSEPLLRKYNNSTDAYYGAKKKKLGKDFSGLLDKWTEAVGKHNPRVKLTLNGGNVMGKVIGSKRSGTPPREHTVLTIKLDKPVNGKGEIRVGTQDIMDKITGNRLRIDLDTGAKSNPYEGMNR